VEHGLVSDIAICIIAAWIIAVIAQVARQPLLLAYLVAGFAVGPCGFKWVTDIHSIEMISSIGLSLLLFMIGLEIDLRKMINAGKVITITALSQIVGCVLLGWAFFAWVGPAITKLEAFYLAVAAAMSSTVIIVKILYDKRELETLAGRITLGVLVLQDLATILFLAVQPNLKHPTFSVLAVAFRNVGILIVVAFVVSRYVLPPMFKFVARLPELVLVGALAWCFLLAGLAGHLNLSREMGALVAGMMISTFPYTLDVVAKVTSIRDFFVTLFFVGLGLTIPMPTWNYLTWMVIFALFLVGSRLLTIFPPLYKMRQGFRVSLFPAISLSQMSELSLVLLLLGAKSGDVSANTVGIATFAFAFLAVASTYGIVKNDFLLTRAIPWLKRLGCRDLDQEKSEPADHGTPKRICLLGFFWTASSLLEEITRQQPALLKELMVVDFNPHVYEHLRQRGVHVVYGDIAQRDVLHHAGVSHAEIIICSLPNTILKGANNFKILRQLRELNPTAQIVVHAESLTDIPALYAEGANYVTAPRLLEAADLLNVLDAAQHNLLDEKRKAQSEQLTNRREVIA
jgi:Kef-type K+ transport system membrane component KefB/Trk K+ transport system NAD-binding subunit